MASDRIRAITDAAEWFAQTAREAEAAGDHGRAAAFFKAALAILQGQPLEQVQANLERSSLLPPVPSKVTASDDVAASRRTGNTGPDDGNSSE
jgi:hypothetical protein